MIILIMILMMSVMMFGVNDVSNDAGVTHGNNVDVDDIDDSDDVVVDGDNDDGDNVGDDNGVDD